MALTKPAGAFLQIIGALIALFGFAKLVGGSVVFGLVVFALGAWLVIEGGKPARQAPR